MKKFASFHKLLGEIDAETISRFVSAATDISLVVNADGLIDDISISSDDLTTHLADGGDWAGRLWAECSTSESRRKIGSFLSDAAKGTTQWAQISHPAKTGADLPILYRGTPSQSGRIVVFGRDLRLLSTLQQRLIEAQQSLERDYARLRHVETRYRLLFETSSEALIVLDATSQKALEINPSARLLLGDAAKQSSSIAFPLLFQPGDAGDVQSLLAVVRATGKSDAVAARLSMNGRELSLSANLFRQENMSLILMRLSDENAVGIQPLLDGPAPKLLTAAIAAPDGLIVTSPQGQITAANTAFIDMLQLVSGEQLIDTSLESWLGRSSVDLNVLVANLRQGSSVRLFATQLRGALGQTTDVEISAASHGTGKDLVFVFAVRDVARRISGNRFSTREQPRSLEQMIELIGRVPMKDLVREATDLIERLCIEAALDLTADNRASAAEMLGLSRQSLYIKLRRYGLGELDADENSG